MAGLEGEEDAPDPRSLRSKKKESKYAKDREFDLKAWRVARAQRVLQASTRDLVSAKDHIAFDIRYTVEVLLSCFVLSDCFCLFLSAEFVAAD